MKKSITYADLTCFVDRPWVGDCWGGPGTDLLTYETNGYLIVADDYSGEPGDLTLSVYRVGTDTTEDPPIERLTLSVGDGHTSEAVLLAAHGEAMNQARRFIERYESNPTETVSVYWTVSVAYEIHDLEIPVGATNEEIMALIEEDGSGYAAGVEDIHTHALIVEQA